MYFDKIEAITQNGTVELTKRNGDYVFQDVCVKVTSLGAIYITADKTAVYKIRCTKNSDRCKDCLILGDAWERAYGDLEWKKSEYKRIMPWYFLAYGNKKTWGYGVKTQPNSFCSWQCSDKKITLNIDIKNGSNAITLNGRTIDACTIVEGEYDVDPMSAAKIFCKKMCDNPRFPNRPIFGGNDWYCNYGDNSFEKILVHTKRIVECAKNCTYKPYMVIDDGWELCHHQSEDGTRYYNGGPWKYCNDNFGDMKAMAEAIEKEGAIPGIWFRPLWTVEKFPERYILKTAGMKDTLDPSLPEVLDIIKEDVARLCKWGYKLIKHDFSSWDIFGNWGFEMDDDMYNGECNFSDKSKTTAEIIKNMYNAIREAAGDEVLIMGCNTVSHLSAGIFDIQRTGDDTSGLDWERTKKYGVNTLAFRMSQHNKFYAVDADCVGITRHIDWKKNRQWLDVLAKSGTPLFVSIAEDAYSDEVKTDIETAFGLVSKAVNVSTPMDWLEEKTPKLWESDFGIDRYEW